MIFLTVILLTGQDVLSENLWKLRAGWRIPGNPVETCSFLYSEANTASADKEDVQVLLEMIAGGDKSLLVPLVSNLVSSGHGEMAEVYWNLEGMDLPVTRNELLDALSWYGRFELYRAITLNPSIPPDMEGALHSDQCGGVCALGWMRTREDGLFHGEELVSTFDIKVLSGFFPAVDTSIEYIPSSSLESIFQSSRGSQL